MSKTYPRIIELFKEDLKSGGTLRGIVRKTKLNSNTIANYLEGVTEPTLMSLEKISKAYNKPVAWLRGDTDCYTTSQPIKNGSPDAVCEAQELYAAMDLLKSLPPERRRIAIGLLESLSVKP